MATTDILPFALAGGSNVLPLEEYEDLPARTDGFTAGLARSRELNRVWRQSSFMAAGLAAVVASKGIDVPDDGDLNALVAKITSALQLFSFSTGDVKLTLKTVADSGWVMFNDGSIGNASSGATTRANADTEALFTLLWNNTLNANCPVFPAGRGASAAADFAANKTIDLPKVLGRAMAIAGAGSGLTSRALASILGEETHLLTEDEMPSHTHSITSIRQSSGTDGNTNRCSGGSDLGPVVIGDAGGDDPHNNMQPTTFVNVMVKL